MQLQYKNSHLTSLYGEVVSPYKASTLVALWG